jgi:ADP-heptose:LPS heptosyltransferase
MSKFLILRFSSIGDIVLTTPVIRCLKEQVNGSEVYYCTKKSFSAVIENNPFIDKRFYLENDLPSLLRQLKSERYDAVIDLHHNLRTFRIKQSLGVKSYSFNKINVEKWLMVNFKMDRLPQKHIVDRYLETVAAFGVLNDGKGLDYFLTGEDEKSVTTLPPYCRDGYIGFVIGAKHFTKQLPLEKMIAICSRLNKPIVLLGGKEDVERGEAVALTRPEIFNACGKYSLNQSAALVKHASKIITHDTGLMHIAAAFNKDIVSVWGNTIPEFGMTPYYSTTNPGMHKIMEIKNLYCRPCSKIGFEKCPQKHFRCMMELSPEQVALAANA